MDALDEAGEPRRARPRGLFLLGDPPGRRGVRQGPPPSRRGPPGSDPAPQGGRPSPADEEQGHRRRGPPPPPTATNGRRPMPLEHMPARAEAGSRSAEAPLKAPIRSPRRPSRPPIRSPRRPSRRRFEVGWKSPIKGGASPMSYTILLVRRRRLRTGVASRCSSKWRATTSSRPATGWKGLEKGRRAPAPIFMIVDLMMPQVDGEAGHLTPASRSRPPGACR